MSDKSLEPLINERYRLLVIEGYYMSDQDVSMSGTSYYGFITKDGAYYLMKSIVTGTETAFTYSSGTSGYTTAWIARATEAFQNFADEF